MPDSRADSSLSLPPGGSDVESRYREQSDPPRVSVTATGLVVEPWGFVFAARFPSCRQEPAQKQRQATRVRAFSSKWPPDWRHYSAEFQLHLLLGSDSLRRLSKRNRHATSAQEFHFHDCAYSPDRRSVDVLHRVGPAGPIRSFTDLRRYRSAAARK